MSKTFTSLALVAFASLAALAPDGTSQQVWASPGPHLVGWRNEQLPFVGGLTINDRIYFPSLVGGAGSDPDPSAGPYPLAVLIHGATVAPKDYDELSIHVASHGWIVASVGKMNTFNETYENLANEAKDLVDFVVAESADPSSPYAGLVWDGDYAVIGSSKGGGACELFVGLEPKCRAAALMEPSHYASFAAYDALAAWDGAWLFVAGELDMTNPPSEVKQTLDKATAAARRSYVEIQGAGHAGALDSDTFGLPIDPMPHEEQLALHEQLVLAFLEGELRAGEDAYYEILGGATAATVERESYSPRPPLWVVEHDAPAAVTIGLAGSAGDLALLGVAGAPASIPIQYGTLGIDPASAFFVGLGTLDASGLVELDVPTPADISGLTLWVQALVKNAGGALTRADALVVP